MQLIRHLDELPNELRSGAVAIGNFDGVHRGHARIVQRLLERARQANGPAVVFTFDPHPVRLLRPDLAPPPLTWTDRKAELLAQLGVDSMIAYPTDEALLRLSPEEFFTEIVRRRLDARAMVEGPNFCFGRDRAGTIEVLRQLCRRQRVTLDVVEPLLQGPRYVSSSRVRKLIHDGHVAEARDVLTQPYRIRGMVTHGAARGARIGFPTANLAGVDTLLPAEGVYAGRAVIQREVLPAAVNIGPNPTFDESSKKVEVHVIDFDGSLYGQPIEVDFLTRLRDVRPFASADELKVQLAQDVTRARKVFQTAS